MRTAVIEIAGELLTECVSVLEDHGLKFVGSLSSGFDGENNRCRFIVSDEFGSVLPEQCERGWWLISATFEQETYGKQRLIKIAEIRVIGELAFAPNGQAKIKHPFLKFRL